MGSEIVASRGAEAYRLMIASYQDDRPPVGEISPKTLKTSKLYHSNREIVASLYYSNREFFLLLPLREKGPLGSEIVASLYYSNRRLVPKPSKPQNLVIF